MYELLRSYLTKMLLSLGYGGCDPLWSLGYCRGDGVCWKGIPDHEVLANRLAGPDLMLVLSAIEKGWRIEIRQIGMYCHANSMKLREYEYGEELTVEETLALARFYKAIEKDLLAQSEILEKGAYRILEAGKDKDEVVKSFQKDGFQVLVNEVPDNDFTLKYWEPGLAEEFLNKLALGMVRIFGLRVEVYKEDTLLGEDSLFGCSTAILDDNTDDETVENLVSNALLSAREKLLRLCPHAA